MNLVIKDWIEYIKDRGLEYSFYVQTHITNPFLRPETIDKGIDLYLKYKDHVSVMGVTRHQCRMWYSDKPVNFVPGEIIPTQELEPVLEDNSCLYIFSDLIFERYGRVGKNVLFLEIPWPENIDIDTIEDLKLAQLIGESDIYEQDR